MADIPTTLLVKTLDPENFTIESLFVVTSSIFKFRVKDIKLKDNMVVLSLHYSPKGSTLKRKFGNLPVSYVRVKVRNARELELFERAARMYKFDLNEHSDDEALPQPPPQKRLKQGNGEEDTSEELLPPLLPPPKRKIGKKTASVVEEDMRELQRLEKHAVIDLDEEGIHEFTEDLDPDNQYESQFF